MDSRRGTLVNQRYSNVWCWRMGAYSKGFFVRLGKNLFDVFEAYSQLTEDIRLKACRLFGIQHIELYNGFKGGIEEITKVPLSFFFHYRNGKRIRKKV